MKPNLRREIEYRAHYIEGQGDGIFMVLIRMDAIEDAVRAYNTGRRRENRRRRQKEQKAP